MIEDTTLRKSFYDFTVFSRCRVARDVLGGGRTGESQALYQFILCLRLKTFSLKYLY
jgi:hypothetical protein